MRLPNKDLGGQNIALLFLCLFTTTSLDKIFKKKTHNRKEVSDINNWCGLTKMVSTSYGLALSSALNRKLGRKKTKSLHELICWLSDCLLWISDISRDAGWVNGAHRTAALALMCKSHNLRLNSCNINCIFLDFSQEVEDAVVVFHVTLLTTINSAVHSVSSVSVVIISPIPPKISPHILTVL